MPMNDRMLSVGMTPLPPPVPEIEGFLKKLKRKTSNLSGSWNKRWFFVDQKRREFGYAKSKTPGAPKSSIYLNDITAVVQFDDTHFQVESRTRNFFLCGESKASTTCWVKSLDEYRKKLVEYEKERAKYDATLAAAQSQLSIEARAAFSPKAVAAVGQVQISSSEDRRANGGKAQAAGFDESSRDLFSSSSSLASNSSSSSTASTTSSSKRVGRTVERQARKVERRTPSPAEQRHSRDRDSSASRKSERQSTDKSEQRRDRERDCSREREKDRSREHERERERERGRESRARPSAPHSNSRQFENRSIAESTSVRAHPGKGYVMQAWVDDDI